MPNAARPTSQHLNKQSTHLHIQTIQKTAYLLIPVTGVVLGVSNLVGYFKCSKEAKRQLQDAGQRWGARFVGAAVQSRFQAALSRV